MYRLKKYIKSTQYIGIGRSRVHSPIFFAIREHFREVNKPSTFLVPTNELLPPWSDSEQSRVVAKIKTWPGHLVRQEGLPS